ncbi:MAG: 6-bladed beta-propeller [Candidatus Aminicenantes bacterium]|nr:6-bladed beta-propeller [Candidatus Aminicenantes bacterium]
MKEGESQEGDMKKTSDVISIFAVLVWSAFCKSQKSNASVEVIDGVEFIHNTEIPMFPDKKVSFVEDLFISGEDSDGEIVLFNPRLSLVDDNENIYISETQDQVIKIFDSDGEYIKTLGAKGNGPGEFQRIWNIGATKDGELVALDSSARRTSFFDSSGQFLNSFNWKVDYFNYILVKSSSYIVGERAYPGIRENAYYYVKEFDFDGNEVRSYGEFTMFESLIIQDGGRTTYTGYPVSPSSIFTGDHARELFYHCLNNKYIIEVYDTSGKLFRKIDRPYEPVPFTKKDADIYRKRHDYVGISEVVKKTIKNLKMPEVKNIVITMKVDDKSNLWVRTNEIKEEGDKTLTAFDIFNSDGHYYAKVWAAVLPQIFKKGKMYRMDRDEETGYQVLRRYKVIWE